MKLKDGFVLRKVAGKTVVLPCDDTLDLNMMITLNDTGAFLWKQLQKETNEDDLVVALQSEYNINETTARNSVINFINKLNEYGFVE